jgi:hypothetical protein
MSDVVQVFGRRDDGLATRCGGRRPKSAKARNRGKCVAGVPRALWGFRRGLGLGEVGAVWSACSFELEGPRFARVETCGAPVGQSD